MMKARRSASNCGASAHARREGARKAVASQLAGLPPGTSQQEGGQALTSRMGHMASAVVPPSRVQNL